MPSIVTGALTVGSADASVIVPVTEKSTMLPASPFAAVIASRSVHSVASHVPSPGSAVLLTTYVEPDAPAVAVRCSAGMKFATRATIGATTTSLRDRRASCCAVPRVSSVRIQLHMSPPKKSCWLGRP